MPKFKYLDHSSISELILDLVSKETRPIPPFVLMRKVIKEKKQKDKYISERDFNEVLHKLVLDGKLKTLAKSGYIVMGYVNAPLDTSITYRGRIKINSKGFGFITEEGKDDSKFYVFKTNLNNALDGDLVEFQKMQKEPVKGCYDAVVTKILEHAKDYYVCLYQTEKDGSYKITSDDGKVYLPIVLDSTEGLVNGQKILVKITQFEKDKLYGTVSRIIGHKDDVGVDILSIVLDKGVKPDFDESILEDSKKFKVDITDRQIKLRKDLTNKNIVTIDPATSKDFDDAIYVERNKDGSYKLYVCIADVAHYVKFNSPLDKCAWGRGCSIYLVDRVIPMLPHILSDDVCSLVPNQKRFTVCAEMDINEDATFKHIDVYPAIIESKRRFAYDEVNEYFSGKSKLEKDTGITRDMLDVARKLHHILNEAKYKRGYINFDVPEAKIILDENNFPIDVVKREHGEAQEMIENFMVAANEAVVKFARMKNVPFIYRVHDRPNEEKIKALLIDAKKLHFKINTSVDDIKPKDIAKWFEDNKDNPNLDIINILMLRTMAKAEYSTDPIGHFGLALADYTHFTSPIRRYPDLTVARLFWMYVFDRESYTDNQRAQLEKSLNDTCKESSKNEQIAVDCERSVNAMKFAEYMTRHIGEVFEARVNGVTSFGAFIELPNTIEGLAKINNLGSDYYTYDEEHREIIGRGTKQRFYLGTRVKVQVLSANKETSQIDFKVVEYIGNK